MPNFTAHSSAISENDKSEAVYTLVMSNMKNDNTAQFNNIDTKCPVMRKDIQINTKLTGTCFGTSKNKMPNTSLKDFRTDRKNLPHPKMWEIFLLFHSLFLDYHLL